MKLNHILVILLGFLYSISSQGQNFNFDTKVSDSHQIESIKTSDFFQFYSLSPNDGIKIELTRASIKFIIHTDDSYFVKLAKSLNLNKESDLPIQIQFENGKVINSKSPGMNYVKFLKCEGDELSEAFGLSSSCEFEINIFSLYTDVSGKDVWSKNETFLALFNNNDIKSITICNNYLLSILFDKVKTSEIIKKMRECLNKKQIFSSKEDNIKRVVNFVRFLIDKPWGCLDDKDIKKSQFKQSIIEKNYFKTLENDWDELDINKYDNVYVDGRGYEPISGYYLITPQELRVNDIHISPTVTFAGEKLIAYKYSIYLSERYDMNDANMVMSSIAQNLGFKKTGKFKTYSDLGYILRGSCLYGKYKDSKIFISEPDKIFNYFINIYIIKDKRQSLIQ